MDPPRTERFRLFRCETSRDHDTARVRPIGDLDLGTVPVLSAEVEGLRADGMRRLILDLSDLAFMDSSGLRWILECDAESRQDGFSLAVVPGPPEVQPVFELTQTHSRLSFIDP
jgi:anti-anti-sigma factor